MLKKITTIIFSFVSFLAIALVAVVAVKSPTTFQDIFNFQNSTTSTTANVPYYASFGNVLTNGSGYKSTYFKIDNKTWYSSWGNEANSGNGYMVGWNSTATPAYGGYSFKNEVMKSITYDKTDTLINYSFILMDFDFTKNHLMTWEFSCYDNMTSSTANNIYLIASHNSGTSWAVVDTLASTKLTKTITQKFEYKVDNLIETKTRYGLVVVAKQNVARIEMHQFYTQRISL